VEQSGIYISNVTNPALPYVYMNTKAGTNCISFADVYGDDGSAFLENSFIWSQRCNFVLQGNSANLTGLVRTGVLPLSSFMIDSNG